MVALARLPTRDRLASWGMNVPTQCVLCLFGTESHSHLFFQCPFVAAIWAKFSASPVLLAPVSIQALAGVIAHPQLAGVAGMDAVLKLILQVIVYCIWQERNVRIFQQVSTSVAEVFSRVDRLIKDRLLAISRLRLHLRCSCSISLCCPRVCNSCSVVFALSYFLVISGLPQF